MTGDRVAEIRKRVEALASSEGYGYLNADKAVMANAPADLAYLLDENARLRAQLDTVREIHRKIPVYLLADECDCEGDPKDASHFEDAWSGELLCGTSPTGDYICSSCMISSDEPRPWPCDTFAALNQGGDDV